MINVTFDVGELSVGLLDHARFQQCLRRVCVVGIKDMSTVNPDLSLQDMGLDSMTSVEIKQTLERNYDISMSANEIRALTFAKLDELQASKPQSTGDTAPPTSETSVSQAPAASIHYDLHHLCPTEAVIDMNNVQAEATALAPLFVIAPIEGSVFFLNATMSKIKSAKVYGLQCTSDAPLTSIPELASHYIKVVACCSFRFHCVKLLILPTRLPAGRSNFWFFIQQSSSPALAVLLLYTGKIYSDVNMLIVAISCREIK